MKKIKIIKKIALIMLIMLISLANTVLAHSGRTDSNGGHRDNKNVSGLGSYHYHCGGHPAHLHPNGVCPYSSNASTSTSTKTYSQTKTDNEVTQTAKEVTSISINNYNITSIEVGEKKTLSVSIEPDDATDKTVTWKSSNPAILLINNGEIEGISLGEAEITVTASNGKTATKKIVVNPKTIPVEQIILSKTNITLVQDEEVEIIATVMPSNATNNNVRWISSDPDIATVINGKVIAKRKGEVTITAISDNDIKCCCKVTVKPKEENVAASAGAIGGIGGVSLLSIVGAIIKSKIKK